MLWFAVWTTLVLATLVGAVLLGRRLWRSGKALLAQMRETSAVMATLQTRIEELERLRGPEPDFAPALLATPEQREDWRAARAQNLALRDARRQRRRAAAHARWLDIVTPS